MCHQPNTYKHILTQRTEHNKLKRQKLDRVEIKKQKLLREKIRQYCSMLCAKSKYDRDMIINNCPRFYDLKSNKRYIFFTNSSIKLQFSPQECKFKAIFTFTKSVHAMFLQIFMLTYNNVVSNKPQHSTKLFSFIDQSHSFNSKQAGRYYLR